MDIKVAGNMASITSIRGFVNNKCADDPKSYQFCGTREFEKNMFGQAHQFLCSYTYCNYTATYTELYTAVPISSDSTQFNCDNNEHFSKDYVDPFANISLISSLPVEILCDGNCDIMSCKDEAFCNGYLYGFFCIMNLRFVETGSQLKYVQPLNICDGQMQCYEMDHYLGTSVSDEGRCKSVEQLDYIDMCRRYITGHVVPILNSTRCASIKYLGTRITSLYYGKIAANSKICGEHICIPYCSDYKDQTNCTDIQRVAVVCSINGYESSVSKIMVCQEDNLRFGMCDDKLDVLCVDTSPSCVIHKHLMCDGVTDCEDSSDEINDVCKSMSERDCFRRYIHESKLSIPLAWVYDGEIDCFDGIDEDVTMWSTCGLEKLQRFVEEVKKCSDVYICQSGKANFIESENICDGVESCGNENKICQTTRSRPFVFQYLQKRYERDLVHISALHCIKGMWNQERLTSQYCVKTPFNLFSQDIFGYPDHELVLPTATYDCQYMYGELYLYLSCLGYCKMLDKCPLQRLPPKPDSCPGQFPQRIFTLVNNTALTFLVRRGQSFVNDKFSCNNGFCVDFSKVCDLVDDCGDGSDEKSCGNHFMCTEQEQVLPINQKCDGTFNCLDFSDECNEECSKNILSGVSYKLLAWVIGCLATILNVLVLRDSLKELKNCKKMFQLSNRVMIILIGLGDFCIGIYLIAIAALDLFVFNDKYCSQQFIWLTNFWCSFLGSMNTFGSQLSVFSMTTLSYQRANDIKNSLSTQETVTKKQKISLCLFVSVLIFSSAAIASIPLIDSLRDYFVNGLVYDLSIGLFVGMIDKKKHFNALRAYYGRMRDKTLAWTLIDEMVYTMFSHDYNLAFGFKRSVKFYGNDGVCLFKYFVKRNDPQRAYSLTLLFINVCCFLFISICYVYIGIFTVKGSRFLAKTAGPTGEQVRARNKKLKHRIIALITTDFICWVPFVVTCFLHFFDIIDATPMYITFSIIILPINSVINPLLYDCNSFIIRGCITAFKGLLKL